MPPSPPRVLHLTERLSLGGAGRSLVAATGRSGFSHRVASLRAPDPRAVALAEAADVTIATASLPEEIAAADVLHVHFWNTPELYAALSAPLPPCRVVLTAHVRGTTPPHMLTDALVAFADRIIVTSPTTPAAANACYIPAAADFTRLAGLERTPAAGFAIGYVGSLDFDKMHPDYAAMHAAIGAANLQLEICGAGPAKATLRRQLAAGGLAARFHGFVEDLRPVFARLDLFGYPLRPGTFAASELVVHEAMFAGLACVVLAEDGVAPAIVDDETGYRTASAPAYTERVRRLADDPAARQRIGANAAAHARDNLDAGRIAQQIDAVYADLLERPRVARCLPCRRGAAAWLWSLGTAATPFAASLAGDADGDAAIFAAHPALASADAGGVLHYRRVWPVDPALRFWAGLVLLGQGRPALAAGEFSAAARLGFDGARCAAWLDRARRRASPIGAPVDQ